MAPPRAVELAPEVESIPFVVQRYIDDEVGFDSFMGCRKFR